MKNIDNIHEFLKTDSSNQSSFFESQINADDIDYHGKIASIKKDVEREQKKLVVLTKVDELNDMLKSLMNVIEDLNETGIKTHGLQDVYYKLASVIKSLV
jgi:hypothetical protein